uniref:EGF-like domain-containing protein n=1 Tax=Romanomermis culicivorax TaxID=13658 RepID=A0A915JIG6_ROMCU
MGRINHVTRAKCPKYDDDGYVRDASSCGCQGFWTGVECNMINCGYKLDLWPPFQYNVSGANNETATLGGSFWDGLTLNQFQGGSLCGCKNGGHCSTTVCKHRRFYGRTYCYPTYEDDYTIGQNRLSDSGQRSYSSIVPCSPVNGSYFSYSQLRLLPTCKCWRGGRRADGTCRCPDGFSGALCELESGNQKPMVGLLFDMNGNQLYGYNFHQPSTSSSAERYSSSGHNNQIFDYFSTYNSGAGGYGRTSSSSVNYNHNNGNSLTIFLFVVMLILSMLMCFQRRRTSWSSANVAVHRRCTVLAAAGPTTMPTARYSDLLDHQWGGQLYLLRSLAGLSQNFRASFPSQVSANPDSTNNNRRGSSSSSCYVYERGSHAWRLVRVSTDRSLQPLMGRSGRSNGRVEHHEILLDGNERQTTRTDGTELPSYDEATQAPPPYGQIL